MASSKLRAAAKYQLQWQASNKAVQIARQRYNAGTGEFLDLLDAERELLRSRDQLAVVQQQSFTVSVTRTAHSKLS